MEEVKSSLRTGLSFGLTSGVITTLGLMVGLHSGTHSRIAVIGGIMTIAIADALSDALGIHISQESQHRYSTREIWTSTLATFLSKLVFALTFIVPVLLLPLSTAVLVSVIWGMFILSCLSIAVAKDQKVNPAKVVFEHLAIAIVVILITHYLGGWIAKTFN